ncbi:MAG: response regulator [Acidobacteriota bacterium]|jgi:DNA-binding NtrC family response regulator
MGSNGVDISVLVVDDDADLRSALTEYISKMGVRVRTAGNLAEAQKLLQTEAVPFDLVLCDLKIPGGSGMDVLRAAHTRSPESLVTIITGYASIETAIEAIRLGAYNYITKPFSLSEIGVQVRNMIERVTLSKENARLSVRLQELYQQVNRAQNERADVFRLHEEISRNIQENTRRLDKLLMLHSTTMTGVRTPVVGPDKSAILTLIKAIERLDKLKETTGISPVELEEKKRDLVEEFIGHF